jgi:hypothetical protein
MISYKTWLEKQSVVTTRSFAESAWNYQQKIIDELNSNIDELSGNIRRLRVQNIDDIEYIVQEAQSLLHDSPNNE